MKNPADAAEVTGDGVSTCAASFGSVATTVSLIGKQDDQSVQPELQLVLDDTAFVVCWWMVCGFHACEIAFLVATTRLYFWLLHDELATYNFLNFLSFEVTYATLRVMTWGFALVAGLHCLAVLRVLSRCVKARRLVFADASEVGCWSSRAPTTSPPSSWSFVALLQWMASVVDIRGKYFDDFFLFQEYLEVASQIYQANRMSFYIATRWINNLFVGMICINSMSTPLIHLLIPRSQFAVRRMLEVTMSAFLSFINSVVIPIVIFAKYVQAYRPDQHSFGNDILFGDVEYPKALHENEQLFVTSWLDFLSTLWPHISLLNCLLTCQSVVTRSAVSKARVVATMVSVVPRSHASLTFNPIPVKASPDPPHASRLRRVIYNLLWISGVVVLGIHIDAQSTPEAKGCILGSAPWFSGGRRSCVVININCHRLGIEGNKSDIEALLKPLNTDVLDDLIVTHCPRLQVPPIIRTFHTLNGIEIYNTTIDSWPAASSPRTKDYESLQYIYIVLSNLTSLPDGLVQDAFAPQDMYFYGSNVTTLPLTIKDTWVNIGTMLLEYTRVEEVPAVVFDLPLDAIAFTGSPIRTIDADIFANKELFWLYLSGCPVRSLRADTIGSLQQLTWLPLEFTDLNEVPSFIQEWYLAKREWVDHSVFGSPYCNKTVVDAQEKEYQQRVCAKDHASITGFYPIEAVVAQRPP